MPSLLRPVYIFCGFLDSGKTTAIKNTLSDKRFTENEKTLICSFEQGDVEYDEDFLKKTNSFVEYLDFNNLTPQLMNELDQKYKPDRVFIELNGMDNGAEFYRKGMIKGLDVAQVITIINGSSFKIQMNNMKQFLYYHVAISEVVVINRCDGQDLRYFRNNLKGINQSVEIVYEDKNGNVTNKIEDNYFDVSKPLDVSDSDFGLWYMDVLDNPQKYNGSSITINGFYKQQDSENKSVLGFGRQAMVCCSNDLQDILFPVYFESYSKLEKNKYYSLKGKLKLVDTDGNQQMIVLYLDSFNKIEAPKDSLVYFN